MKPKFKIGDNVRIVNYGHPIWSWGEMKCFKLIEKSKNGMFWYDICPELVGKKAVVDGLSETQGKHSYFLAGVNKHAWYSDNQLELCR